MLALATSSAACIRGGVFHCATDGDCGPGGQCEATTFCSFADTACDGRRYGEASGPSSNRCVNELATDDAGIDSPGPTDGGSDAMTDAMPTCTDMTVLAGTSDHTGSVTDSIPSTIADAFGYGVPATATARCAWVWVGTAPSGDIRVGVYTNVSGAPSALLAQVRIPHPSGGNRWVSGLLDSQVPLTTSEIVWLGMVTTGGSLGTPIQSGCGANQYALHNDTSVTQLPNPFVVDMTFATCAAAVFLGP